LITSRPVLVILTLLLLTLGLAPGCGIQQAAAPASPEQAQDISPDEFNRVAEVWGLLEAEHIKGDSLDAQTISDGAIRGMLAALDDPYASYLDSRQFEIANQDLKGYFEGIGAEVGLRDGRITILAPLPDTPAERAGIRPGDVILEIEGESAENISLLEAVNKIRGEKGTTVSLLVLHLDSPDPVTIIVTRGVIPLVSVRLNMRPDNTGHMRISSFSASTNKELLESLDSFQGSNGSGLVIDLRDNPGGLLTSVVDVTSQFLDEGLVLYQIDAHGKRTDWGVKPGGSAKDIPVVVLVNQFSASASEVFAGALMDHERAQVVGIKTFGKGSVNNLWPLKDGSGINFTVANWYTPDGFLIEGEGIAPDVVFEPVEDTPTDVHLDKAVQILQARITRDS
jgi:carboxyl-terminal processing protease